jgi:hypothetical protein
MHEFKAYLDAIDPRLFYIGIAMLVGAVIFGWKKVHPASFFRLPTQYRALPAVILGAVTSASGASEIKRAIIDAVIGVFAGITAVGGHEAVSRLFSLDAKKAAKAAKIKTAAAEEKKNDVSPS